MAINDLPTPTDPTPRHLRSYREQASNHLALKERRQHRQPLRPLEPSDLTKPRSQRKPRAASPTARCRSRTPPPQVPPRIVSPDSQLLPSKALRSVSPDDKRPGSKAPRSVSPGGTPTPTAGAALRKGLNPHQGCQPTRKVSWADVIVSAVRDRPRTLRCDVPSLYYSKADERRFRREADAEADLALQDGWCDPTEALEDDKAEAESFNPPSPSSVATDGHQHLWSPQRERKDYAISRAVVVFGDSTKTYCSDPSPIGCPVVPHEPFSFDDTAFWNGQLTWS